MPLVLAITGCVEDGDGRGYPIEPGGSPAPPLAPDGTQMLRGRICVVLTLTNLRECRRNDLAGFDVSIGDLSATTDDTGAFTLPTPTGSLLSFTVAGPGAITTTMPFSPSLTLPVIDADVYARALRSNQIFAPPGTGAILGTIARGGRPASGATVSTIPAGIFTPFYDAPMGTTGFGTTSTGARGVFWVPGLTFGPTDLTFRSGAGGETTVSGIQVVNGGVTILDSVPLP